MPFLQQVRSVLTVILSAALLSACVPSAPNQAEEEKEPHFLAGKSRVSAMDYKGGIECYEKALEANPQSASAHFELGWLFDQKESDPAAAIYHYSQYLKLRPGAENEEMVKTRIVACKQEIARTVSLGPVTQGLEREFAQLSEENKRLKEELEKLKGAAAATTRVTNATPGVIIVRAGLSGERPATEQRSTPSSNTNNLSRLTSDTSAGRTHTVKAGETPSMIARKYGLRITTLLAANPKLDPRRMRVGQVLNIPAS
jgi:LysM repeat protein